MLFNMQAGTIGQSLALCNLNSLNIQSSGQGALTAALSSYAGLTLASFAINICGGILVV
jgi:hypothetical protein